MPTNLDPLDLFELSLVDAPANKESKVTIFKRHDGEQEMEDDEMSKVNELEGQVTDLSAKVDYLSKQLQAATAKRSEERAPPEHACGRHREGSERGRASRRSPSRLA